MRRLSNEQPRRSERREPTHAHARDRLSLSLPTEAPQPFPPIGRQEQSDPRQTRELCAGAPGPAAESGGRVSRQEPRAVEEPPAAEVPIQE
jgi:hypothetical protein